MKTSDSAWPYRPVHITNDGGKSIISDPRRKDLNKLTGVGIIPNEHLQGIETTICANLKCPTTIIEFSQEGDPVRTDSPLLDSAEPPFGLHPPCEILRNEECSSYCYDCDNAHAVLFWSLSRSNLINGINKRINESDYIQAYQLKEPRPEIIIPVNATEKNYLEYDCPLLGYREIVFPVFFEDNVIAVLFIGQICLKEKLELIIQLQEKFFKQYKLEKKPAILKIQEEHQKWVNKPENIIDKKKYQKIISKACSEIKRLEDTLNDQMKLQRERYVFSCVDRRIKKFRDNLPKEADSEEARLLLWRNVEERLKDIVDDFSVKYIVVFGSGSFQKDRATFLEVVAKAGILPQVLSSGNPPVNFDVSRFSPEIAAKPSNSKENPIILKGLVNCDVKALGDIILFTSPVFFYRESSICILIGFRDNNSSKEPENMPDGYLDISLRSFYSVATSSLSSILAAIAKRHTINSFRILGHEIGQLTAGLDWLRAVYLADVHKLRSITKEKADDLCNDIEGYMSQLLFLSKQAKMLLEIGPVNKTFFLPFKELLFKWKDIYRLEAIRKKLQFDIYSPASDDPLRPQICADRMLLEQLVYNLVNNAVKYCYRGTKIHLDCKKETANSKSPYILTVSDYGMKMDESSRAYELFGRGANVDEIEGLGIGLFIVKQIAEAHKGSVTHKCEKVSNYNVSLIEPYLCANILWKQDQKIFRMKRELKRLKNSGEYSNVVSLTKDNKQRYSNPTRGELVNSINKKTWKVTFHVTIPN